MELNLFEALASQGWMTDPSVELDSTGPDATTFSLSGEDEPANKKPVTTEPTSVDESTIARAYAAWESAPPFLPFDEEPEAGTTDQGMPEQEEPAQAFGYLLYGAKYDEAFAMLGCKRDGAQPCEFSRERWCAYPTGARVWNNVRTIARCPRELTQQA